MLIRPESLDDVDAIHVLTVEAFAPMWFSDGSEAPIIRRLREDGDLTLSLVATDDAGAIVGHVAFSPVTVDGSHDGWFGLGPVSVRADVQRQGIGRALIEHGLAALEGGGAYGCALIGDPAIYGRLGFVSDGALSYRDVDPAIVQYRVFQGEPPRGELRFAPAFESA